LYARESVTYRRQDIKGCRALGVTSKRIISGLDSALRTMTLGGVRQVIIPYGPLSYPSEDASHDKVGPKPTTFSGMRALNFYLRIHVLIGRYCSI
jgi:hypothetical protein